MTETAASRKAAFLDQLGNVGNEMNRHSVPYRVIGSIAVAGYGLAEPSFARESVEPTERIPDIDLVVPRIDLKAAREVRERILGTSFPVKIGLAIPSLQIDMRPEAEWSYLTHGRHSVAVDQRLFDSEHRTYDGVPFDTVPVDTLRHIYDQMTPYRDKDVDKRQVFNDVFGGHAHNPDDPYLAFHEYETLMAQKISLRRKAVDAATSGIDQLPPRQAALARQIGLRAASFLRWR